MYPVLIDPEVKSHEPKFNPDIFLNFPVNQSFGNGFQHNGISENHSLILQDTPSSEFVGNCISQDLPDVPDFSDACLKFLADILEEDLDENPATVQDFRALQATEKSLYDVLGEEYSPSDDVRSSLDQNIVNQDVTFDGNSGISHGFEGYTCSNGGTYIELMQNKKPLEPNISLNEVSLSFPELKTVSLGLNYSDDCRDGVAGSPLPLEKGDKVVGVNRLRRKKNARRDVGANDGGRSSKQQASSNEDYVEMKEYDDVILSREDRDDLGSCGVEPSANDSSKNYHGNGSKAKITRGRKQNNAVEEVDLRTLLVQCAQAVSSFDLRGANERLRQIRQHCSPYGNSIQRLSHYFANGLEARLAGTGSTVSGNIVDARISSSDFLKAYRMYVSSIPFQRLSHFLANNTILKLAEKATKIHIIDFGVLLGLQWPCLIQNLSKRHGGPPKLRITGIDYPQQGFRPAERVEATGHRLAGYCERFNVPFQYQAIAQKWDSITPEDIKVESDEFVIVNCMYRCATLLDETVEMDSQKDAFLKLIKQLNPSLFILGVVNGTYNAPFFITRFKEALFHYSSLYDILQETSQREDHERLLIESELCGREVLNVVACEGAERIQRPETYKQWQVRTARAGLKQLPLDGESLRRAKAMVKANYHKDFVVDEDKHWMLQGWKGRTLFALSTWQPC